MNLRRSFSNLGTLACLCFAVVCCLRIVQQAPFIGGVDLYYYLVTARDLVIRESEVTQARYFYFPGVYIFWGTVFRIFGFSLAAVQFVFAGLLIGNSIAVGTISWIATRRASLACLGSGFYLLVAVQLEALLGTTEPLVTFWFLLGVIGWSVAIEKSFLVANGFLALGVALAIFSKQQGILVTIGAIPLLISAVHCSSYSKAALEKGLLFFPLAAVCFVSLFWLEGGGIAALRSGFAAMYLYRSTGAFLHNTACLEPLFPLIGLCMVGTCCAFGSLIRVDVRSRFFVPALACFSCGGVFAMLQFTKRGYGHYALLVLPCAIIVCVLVLDACARLGETTNGFRRSLARARLSVCACVAAGLVGFSSDQRRAMISFLVGQPQQLGPQTALTNVAPLCSVIRPDTEVLVVPGRANEIHWQCQTKSTVDPYGYGFGPIADDDILSVVGLPGIEVVVLLQSRYGPYEADFFARVSRKSIEDRLESLGFVQVLENQEATVFVPHKSTSAV